MALKVTNDGRLILTGVHYTRLKNLKRERQNNRCARCGKLNPTQLHHKTKRGMGGGQRNDTTENTQLLCAQCHSKSHSNH